MAPQDSHSSITFVTSKGLVDPQWYSHGVIVEGSTRTIRTSGQIGQRADGSWPLTLVEQVQQAVTNLDLILKAAGASSRDITHLRFYVANWELEQANDLVGPVLGLLSENYGVVHRPLTTLVPVPKLSYPEAKFEIEAIASTGGASRPWSIENDMIHKPMKPTTILGPASPIETDVVVIGGGFSGLTAAYELHQAGFSVIVLEAKYRVGGRSRTQRLATNADAVIELGATWINKKTQPAIYALVQKFGLETAEQYTEGDQVYQDFEGKIYRCDFNQEHKENAEHVQNFLLAVDEAAASVDIRAFDGFPEDEDVTLAQWVASKGLWDNPSVRATCHLMCSALVGREPQEVGAHYLLDYINSCGGYMSVASEGEDGAQSLKIKTGTSSITDALASSLPVGSVMLNSPVEYIRQAGDNEVHVKTSSGATYKAKKAIVAIPTNTYTNIQFIPPLPAAKRALVTRTKPGIYAKIILTYSSPWWREAGLVGKFESVIGPVCFSWETSDESKKQYSLAIFIAGDPAAEWHKLGELEREEAVVEHLATLVGDPALAAKARDVKEINMMEWSKEEYVGGAPTSALGPGILKKYGVTMREAFGSIHFGGGETAYEWKGYMEGAIRAGQRVAHEVVEILGDKATV